MSSIEDPGARGVRRRTSLTDPLTLIDLGVLLSEIFTFLAEPRNVLNTSAACRSWRSLANDEDVWRAKAEEEFGASSVNTAPSCGLAYQRAWIEAAPGGRGASRLLLAAMEGRADVIRCMLRAGPDVNKGIPNGTTPLLVAAQNGHVEVVRCLVEAGADKDKAMTANGSMNGCVTC